MAGRVRSETRDNASVPRDQEQEGHDVSFDSSSGDCGSPRVRGAGEGAIDVGSWDALVRLNFMEGSMFRPYLAGGATGCAATSKTFNGATGDYKFSGVSPTAGLGAHFFVSPVVAIDGVVFQAFGY